MAKPIDVATNALVTFVSGTAGTAIHFIGFKTLTGTQFGVPTRSLVDIVVGLVSVAASTMWEPGEKLDWLRNIFMLLGATLMGLGVAEWAKWTPQPVVARLPYRPPAAAPRPVTAPVMF